MTIETSAKSAYKMASQIYRAKIRAEKSVFSSSISVKDSNEMYATYRGLVEEFKMISPRVRDMASVAAIRSNCDK